MISPSCSNRCGRGWQPHTGVSSVDCLLAAPREETHNHCQHWPPKGGKGTSWPTYGVLQVAPRERGGASHPMLREGFAKRKRSRPSPQ
ncbi:unnamed protein product [Spirodela intermedia]|uniref:Uncharacterized protein n=1 Tax=Spirodela intermedia TaxID=51605 RepID=A0A7I8JL25_SPIIN|nr:unnamed protein product [Spirodela intermedia]CAA6670848.1 unnamed protein product [Spirodela intermedia]